MMSRVPMASDKGPLTHDFDFIRRQALLPIGISADAIATMEGFARADCDAYAAESQQRAAAARAGGRFQSLVPVRDESDAVVLAADETIRPATTRESLAGMVPAFAEMGAKFGFDAAAQAKLGLATIDHVHHAGNSPATADGASLVSSSSHWRGVARAGTVHKAVAASKRDDA